MSEINQLSTREDKKTKYEVNQSIKILLIKLLGDVSSYPSLSLLRQTLQQYNRSLLESWKPIYPRLVLFLLAFYLPIFALTPPRSFPLLMISVFASPSPSYVLTKVALSDQSLNLVLEHDTFLSCVLVTP